MQISDITKNPTKAILSTPSVLQTLNQVDVDVGLTEISKAGQYIRSNIGQDNILREKDLQNHILWHKNIDAKD